jgi:hypothetical protein
MSPLGAERKCEHDLPAAALGDSGKLTLAAIRAGPARLHLTLHYVSPGAPL